MYFKVTSLLLLQLQWRHNGRDGVSNHQPHDCLLSRLFGRRSKKESKLCVTGLCAGKSPGTGEFPAQMASNAENVSIRWRHHDTFRASDYFSDETIMSCRPTRPIIPEFNNIMTFYNDITWAMASKITSNSTVLQQLVQAKIQTTSNYGLLVLCEENPTVIGGFITWASNTESVSMSGVIMFYRLITISHRRQIRWRYRRKITWYSTCVRSRERVFRWWIQSPARP